MLRSATAFNRIDLVDAALYMTSDWLCLSSALYLSQFPCRLLPLSPLRGDRRVECNQTQGTLWAIRSICWTSSSWSRMWPQSSWYGGRDTRCSYTASLSPIAAQEWDKKYDLKSMHIKGNTYCMMYRLGDIQNVLLFMFDYCVICMKLHGIMKLYCKTLQNTSLLN